jgi:DNA repair protein RadC
MSIRHWPLAERPREKLLKLGAHALSDVELLAILLGRGTQGQDALSLARGMLVKHKGLRLLFSAGFEDFCMQRGLGLAKYAQLQAALEIAKRHLQENLDRKDVLSCADDTERFLIAKLRDYQQEVFACLFLDNAHRIIHFEVLFHGTINTTNVHPREIIRRALHHNAAAVILAHNHPSGIAEPSLADKAMTTALVEALRLIDVRVLDHIIVGDNQTTSFVNLGLL